MSNIRRFLLGRGSTVAYAIMSAILAFVPEDMFKCGFIPCEWPDTTIIVLNRIWLFILIFVTVKIIYNFLRSRRNSVTLSDKTMTIKIEYGDLYEIKQGKKVIHFDECYTTTVGDKPEDIKPNSVCGQYLTRYPIDDMQSLLADAGIRSTSNSQYKNKSSYTPGTIVPRGDFLLMAFAKLDGKGRGNLKYDEYLAALNKLWEQVDCYHGTDDVYVPVLGSRITRFDKDLTQQELLDIMISSYRLSTRKLRNPNTLHIVCTKRDGFSLNNIFGVDK